MTLFSTDSSLPYHYFCFSCDKKEFSLTEINENLIIDYRGGDLICGQCGQILSDRLIYQGNEEMKYSEDYEAGIGASRSRTSGKSHYYGCEITSWKEGPEELRKTLERAQNLTLNRKERIISSSIGLVNELACKLNLTTTIKVS